MSEQEVKLLYRNHRGEVAERHITPTQLKFGTFGDYYTDPQWLLDCWDHDKLAYRTFALRNCNFARLSDLELFRIAMQAAPVPHAEALSACGHPQPPPTHPDAEISARVCPICERGLWWDVDHWEEIAKREHHPLEELRTSLAAVQNPLSRMRTHDVTTKSWALAHLANAQDLIDQAISAEQKERVAQQLDEPWNDPARTAHRVVVEDQVVRLQAGRDYWMKCYNESLETVSRMRDRIEKLADDNKTLARKARAEQDQLERDALFIVDSKFTNERIYLHPGCACWRAPLSDPHKAPPREVICSECGRLLRSDVNRRYVSV